jgi:hypothetical protein
MFRELTVSDQICYTNVMDAKAGDSESGCWFIGRCPVWLVLIHFNYENAWSKVKIKRREVV